MILRFDRAEKESKKYGQFALSGVPIDKAGLPAGRTPFISGENYLSEFDIIIGGSNFGCGSSREHAPFALEKAGVQAIIAESYARIFYRNSVDGGFLVPLESQSKINNEISTGDELEVNLDSYILQNKTSGKDYTLQELGSVLPIVEAGGIFEYARKNNMI